MKVFEAKPFNKYFLNGCFKHQLLTIIDSYNLNTNIYLLNNTFTLENKNNEIKPIALYFFKYKDIYKKIGIKVLYKRSKCKNNIKYLINNLNNNKVIIVAVDCYNLKYRKDLYHKIHSFHYILIYGYNKDKFYVVDQNYINSVIYIKKMVSFAEIDEAINGYINTYKHNNETIFYVVNKISKSAYFDMNSFYLNIKKKKNKLNNGMKLLSLKFNEIKDILLNETKLKENINQIIKLIMVLRGNAESFKFRASILKNKELSELLNELVNNYTFTFAILCKYEMSKKYNSLSIKSCINKLDEIYLKERKALKICYASVKS